MFEGKDGNEVDEVAALQQRLGLQKATNAKLQAEVAKAAGQKESARQAVLSGVEAGRKHLERLRSEQLNARQWVEDHNLPSIIAKQEADAIAEAEEGPTEGKAASAPEAEPLGREAQMRLRQLQVQARELRHELARWKHQVEMNEAKRPKQEDEIVALKAELTHTLDIWASTQHAVKHHEVEREFQKQVASVPSMDPDDDAQRNVPLHGGGHGSVEAMLECHVREKAEGRNIRLSGKAKRLTGVVASQQLLIQRLEKQVLHEEHLLEQKDRQLQFNAQDIAVLTKTVRQISESTVAGLLGINPMRRSASVPQLPAI